MQRFIYFIESGEGGPIKIGIASGSPSARLSSLQTGNPEPLRLLAFIPDAVMEMESSLHKRFQHLRIRRRGPGREWFRPNEELLEFMRPYRVNELPSRMPNRSTRGLRKTPGKCRMTVVALMDVLHRGAIPGAVALSFQEIGDLFGVSAATVCRQLATYRRNTTAESPCERAEQATLA